MDSIDDLNASAGAALARGDTAQAARIFADLAGMFPKDKMAALTAAQGLRTCRDPGAAAAVLEAAFTHAPRSIGLLEALVATYVEMRALDKTAGALERIAAVFEAGATAAPHDPATWTHLGRTRERLGQRAAAVAAYHRAVALAPAEDTFRRILALEPGNAQARAFLTGAAPRPDAALAVLVKQAWAAEGMRYHDVARANYEAILRQEPGHLYALSRLLTFDGREGRMEDAETHHTMLVDSLARTDFDAAYWPHMAALAYQHVIRPLPQPLYKAVARALDRDLVAMAERRPARPRRTQAADAKLPAAGRRLKVGYLSGLFRDHPVGHVTAALFAAHDRARFDVHVFFRPEDGPPDAYTEAIKKGAEHFFTLSGNPGEMADVIAAQDLDLLIFVDGYTEVDVLQAVAARPAPIQIFWLGHPGNCDISAIDYVLADATVIPPDEEDLYDAKVVRLPTAYHCASRHRIADPVSRAWAGLPEEGFIFCTFNNPEKIDRAVFDIWMNILKRVEGSMLWLSRGTNPVVEINLRTAAAARGVDGARLIFAARVPDKAHHLARHGLCGLFLDTFLVNAHTTALDALWAGLPVLTLEGPRFGSRFGAMALRALGLDELITPTPAAYEARAVYLATHPAALADIRGRLAANRYTEPLFQTDVFCRGLEDALERIHRAHVHVD